MQCVPSSNASQRSYGLPHASTSSPQVASTSSAQVASTGSAQGLRQALD